MLKDQLGIEAELAVGSPGGFEVWVDGALVAAKQLGGFPSEGDILAAVAKKLAPQKAHTGEKPAREG